MDRSPAAQPTVAFSWLVTAGVFAVALAVFLLLPQRTLHGMDADYFIVWLEQGNYDYKRHVAYLHFCGWLYDLFAPLGMTALGALLLGSALGAALGLAGLFRGMRWLLGQGPGATAAARPVGVDRPALVATLAVALAPSWFFYATCAEIPGVFLAGAGAAWWAFGRWLAAPSVRRACVLGAACAVAGGIHSFGHALSPTFVLMALVLRWPGVQALSWRRRVVQGAALVAVQLGLALALAWSLTGGAGGQAGDAVHHLEERWTTFAPLTTPVVFVREWLLPFLPWSLLAFAALLEERARAWGWAVVMGLLVHLPISVLLLGHYAIDEGGAYQVALAPAAVLAARALLRPRRFLLAVLVAAGASLAMVQANWRAPTSAAFVKGLQELRDERQFFLVVGKRHELDGARSGVKDLVVVEVGRALGVFLLESEQGKTLEQWWDDWTQGLAAQGMPLLLSESARLFFADSQIPEMRALWTGHVQRRYQLVPERREGFTGVWVLSQ